MNRKIVSQSKLLLFLKQVEIERDNWTGVKNYQEKCEGWSCTQNGTEDIWKEIKEKVKDVITKHKIKIISWKLGKRDWYNKKWKGKKRELRKILRDMKKRRNKEEYPRKRKEYREWCREQKKHEKEEKIRNIKSETEAWKYINKCRKKKTERISENINIDKWKDHFAEPLGGTQEKAVWQMESEEEDNTEEREKIEDIMREKLIEMLKKLKKAKAPRIENEAWRFMPKEIGKEFWKLINRIWKEGIPGDWNKGMIIQFTKKKETSLKIRGITLMNKANKIYASN